MIYQSLTKSKFRDVFHHMGRDNFSYDGLGVLYDYLEEAYGSYDLDVIALCCDFTESSIADALKAYDLESLDELRDNTLVLDVDDETIIYQN